MRCAFCKGDLEPKLIRYVQEYKGNVIIIENVPAEVCRQCHERVLHPDVVDKLQKIVWGEAAEAKPVSVDSYDFAEVA